MKSFYVGRDFFIPELDKVKIRLSLRRFLVITSIIVLALGLIKQTEIPPKQTHDYRKLVSDKVRDLEEERYFAKSSQGELTFHKFLTGTTQRK